MKCKYAIKCWHGSGVKRWELHQWVQTSRFWFFKRYTSNLLSTHTSEADALQALKNVAAGWYTEDDYDAQGRRICYGW
ncbi:hypothetical protein BST65_35295 [Bradyrhizobium canariense]|nr:hypothetical protein BST65_35295 [Bradyrhizobium canariense]OSI26168.1 hypothetical protein BST66_38060 [Bradyrhizobium canariense]OSI37683.1 hypothetical protein BSZ20_38100 [Bradyrhizobium canariense]OSI42429.1 hypothetical protein BST67_37440 [Bradyrhizobium canariense]OSI57266.1 hypothetical protein BSZ15_14365 [Bradyrhizobium canariense]